MTQTESPHKPPPELCVLFDAIKHMDANKEAPVQHGNAGRYKEWLDTFTETLTMDGFKAYQGERTSFFNKNEYASAMFAAYGGSSEKKEKQKTLVNFRELRNRPRPQWVIEGFIYENTIIELYAEAGCYKSFLAFDWSARIATGTDWLGHRVVNKGSVVYIAAEGADGYISRGDAWCEHNGIPFDDLARDFWFWPEPLPLNHAAEVSLFIDEVADTLKEQGESPRLVVVDTLLRCSNGENINMPDVMGAIFRGAETIKSKLKVPNVLIVHHQGKNAQLGGMGSVVLKNNCDLVYSMAKDSSVEGQVILKAEKMKDKPETTTYLRTQRVYYGMTEDDSSLILVLGEKPTKEEKQPPIPKSQSDLLAILDKYTILSYTEWWNHYKGNGGKKRTFDDAIKALMDKNFVEQHEGKYRRYQEPTTLQGNFDTYENEAQDND